MPKRPAPSRRNRGDRPTRTEGKKILILSDGTETEPNYFKALKLAWRLSAIEVPSHPIGQAKQVVEKAQKLSKDYDEVWCVVDKDDLSATIFDAAIASCKGNIHVAWSNESFELWFVLHYTNAPARGLDARKRYLVQLDQFIGSDYGKAEDNWSILEPYLETALLNADRLMAQYTEGELPSASCPGTRVQNLMRLLQSERDARKT
jgi:RloB-like protein